MSNEIKQYLDPGKKNLILIYGLYLLGTIVPILPIIGAVFAFAHKTHNDELYRSHYIFAFRSFIFGILGFVIGFITMLMVIGFFINILVFIWFVVRSIFALRYLLSDEPHPNPLTLWIR
jgi:uncharacterized membrane protein